MDRLKHRLLSGKFNNPGVFLQYNSDRFYLDLGEGLFNRKDINRTKGVLFSHMHLDHVFGLEKILGMIRGRDDLILAGPANTCNQIVSRMRGYTWNLLTDEDDIVLNIHELRDGERKIMRYSVVHEQGDIKCEDNPGNILLDTSDYSIKYTLLDHSIPTVVYSLIEKDIVNINKKLLQESGLQEGKWIRSLKEAYGKKDTFDFSGKEAKVEDFANLIESKPGQKIVYATDFGYTSENIKRLVEFAEGVDHLYCDSKFLDEDSFHASKTYHLTAAQAGKIAQMANVKNLHLFHHSFKYQNDQLFIDEASQFFKGEIE